MSTPTPATIATELRGRLTPILLNSGRFRAKEDFDVARLLGDCSKLQRADAGLASIVRAEIHQVLGDVNGVEYWANNAGKLGRKNESLAVLAIAYSNLGFFCKASELYAEVVKVDRGQVNENLHLGIACGCFAALTAAAQAWVAAGGSIKREDSVMMASNISAVLKRLEVPEDTLRMLMDEAGGLMRRRSLLWMNEAPDYLLSSPDEAPFLAVRYQLRVSPIDAADMTWELAETLADKGLMPRDITVSFVGIESGDVGAGA